MFVRSDLSLFRNLTTLGQKAGVSREHLPLLVIKELADNALDAGATCKVGTCEGSSYFVEDDGPGIPGSDDEIASLFSFGRPLTSTKLYRLPTRGALGNGLRVVAGAVYGSGGELRVCTGGRWLQLTPQNDGSTTFEQMSKKAVKGTRVEVTFGADLGEVAVDTTLSWAKLALIFNSESTYKGKTSPHWYGPEDFFELLQAHDSTLKKLLLEMDGGRQLVADTYGIDRKTRDFSRAESHVLLTQLRKFSKTVTPTRLGAVGDKGFDGYRKETGSFTLPSVSGEKPILPYVVEVWAIRKKEKDDEPTIHFFVNRTPVPTQAQCYLIKAKTQVHGCGLAHEEKTGRWPMQFFVNVQTPYMPITTDGKEPNLKPLVKPILDGMGKAARRAARASATSSNGAVSKKDVIIRSIPEAINKASGEGRYRFSLRQLFYAVRPLFQEALGGEEPDYNHFASVITSYEAMLGHDIKGIYRDARGTLYHPHTRETIPLGTLNVEQYKRPEWTFNKVLYCEKEGFFPLLLDEKWPERHDCALLTSKGFASRAARDVIDLLGDADDELLFFAIHDSDGPGTKILEALQEATEARPARRVKIIDLGLNPWEAVEMELPTEKVERKSGGRVAVARYVSEEHPRWERWLQTQRVELNAMSSPAFLAWLDKKMAEHDLGKLIPPDKVLSKTLGDATQKEVRERLTEKILKENKIDDQVKTTMDDVPDITTDTLRKRVEKDLGKTPEELWSQPVARVAIDQAEKAMKARKR